ncbi:MAG: hypothetical protein IKO68_09080 [Oscillospiraceae bacterium]|nr:hypothetical protein [Oscillospiraceae bacterium]
MVRVFSFLLVLCMLLGLTACGGTEAAPTLGGLLPGPESQTAPESTAIPAAPYQRPQGADSVKTLLEKSLDYLHNDCDYSRIADVHDQQACVAYILLISLYDTSFATETFTEISWDQAMEKAALILGDAETLEAKDPELALQIRERMEIADPDAYLNELVSNLRDGFKSGEINETTPNYEKLSQLLIDWDKGADYIFEHYPDLLDEAHRRGIVFSLDEALEQFRRYARGEGINNDLHRFKNLEAEYHPENAEPGRNGGIFSYDVGSFTEDHDVWGIDMLYYVNDEVYYLVDFSVWCGSTGG